MSRTRQQVMGTKTLTTVALTLGMVINAVAAEPYTPEAPPRSRVLMVC